MTKAKVSHQEIMNLTREYEHLMCRSVDFALEDRAAFFEADVSLATSLGFYVLSIMRWTPEDEVPEALRGVVQRKLLELLALFEETSTIQEQEAA